jgi:hypothetical protein
MGLFDGKKVTIYNKYMDSITGYEIWLPTLIENVDYTATQGANITKSGLSTVDAVTVFINYSALPKPYKTPKEWQALTAEDKAKYVTFTQGTDFFIFGDSTSNVITTKGFFSDMQKRYSDCYKVTTVDRYDDILPHFEIGGK